MKRRPARNTGARPASIVWLVRLALLGMVLLLGCSSASQKFHFQRPNSGSGVVYVAEQVYGLEEWAGGPESRSYARIYSRAGEADEGHLVRITSDSVVLLDQASQQPAKQEIQIAKRDVLFMRVWW